MKGTIKIGILLSLLLILIMPHISAIEYHHIKTHLNEKIQEETKAIEQLVDSSPNPIGKLVDSIGLLKNNTETDSAIFLSLFILVYIIFPIIGIPLAAFGMLIYAAGIQYHVPILIRVGLKIFYLGTILTIPFQITFPGLENWSIFIIGKIMDWFVDIYYKIKEILPTSNFQTDIDSIVNPLI